jgi:SAM-dependent methyltransferase
MNQRNKNHWYDGRFYDLLIAPNQDQAFIHVKNLVAEGSTVLDVGCGTGRLAFQLADKCSSVDGIDPSARNITIARRKHASHFANRVQFHHTGAFAFLEEHSTLFDYATVSYVIHEIEEHERIMFLQALSSVAHNIIIVDYLVPQGAGYRKVLNSVVEFAAGRSHYRNFKSYIAGGGLTGLVERAQMRILRELKNNPPSSHIVLATPR